MSLAKCLLFENGIKVVSKTYGFRHMSSSLQFLVRDTMMKQRRCFLCLFDQYMYFVFFKNIGAIFLTTAGAY